MKPTCKKIANAAAAAITAGVLLLAATACESAGSGNGNASSGKNMLPAVSYGGQMPGAADREEQLYRFIREKMSGPDGVWTNYTDTEQNKEAATGHEILSESASLLLRYQALAGKREEFAAGWEQAKRVFDRERLFSYRYSPKLSKQYPLNAAVDDLRMIRALYEAGEAFGDEAYTAEADRYALRFAKYNIRDGGIRDFYDETYDMANPFITLCYIDLKTLDKLPLPIKSHSSLMEKMQKIVADGYISDLFPFYQLRYNYGSNSYESDSVRTVESLLTILSLAEMGKAPEQSLRFIKREVLHGALYGAYSLEGQPLNDIQSTAIYALAAMIGSQTNDREMYEAALRRMHAYRVEDPASPLYRGYGDAASGQAYSFDNLMALLAYRY
ncbi:hypothetical protein [Paenibacillus sp. YN15]|uniref:hypothetical protein n=1 Tax=Paenibacillus sp. YN15 TaxID=1742774 RepID=UPI000DCF1F7B|nr:hypothetical protein [Paenibacillus sp. YN15]RAU99580.1 hypothetical protein DQG13_15915 [Paenibacillus sp. YN15]